MRPLGDIAQALLQVAHDGALQRQQGLSLAELARLAQVGYDAARSTVANLLRADHLKVVGTCRHARRGKPINLYATPQAAALLHATDHSA